MDGGCSPGTSGYFRATINIDPNAEQLCIQELAKSVVKARKGRSKIKSIDLRAQQIAEGRGAFL
jgi:hypothetical protein